MSVTWSNSTSYFWGPYHKWFVELGYPDLDINTYEDGEWEIIQAINNPILPQETQWNRVLIGIRNVIPTFGIVENYVKKLDPMGRQFWADEEAKTAAMEAEKDAQDRHAIEMMERRYTVIRNNPDLMDRVVKYGLKEILPENIAKHVPSHQL